MWTIYEDFHISSLLHQDAMLGAPWFHKKYAKLEYSSINITFVYMKKTIKLQIHGNENTISLVNSKAIS